MFAEHFISMWWESGIGSRESGIGEKSGVVHEVGNRYGIGTYEEFEIAV